MHIMLRMNAGPTMVYVELMFHDCLGDEVGSFEVGCDPES
jgi:hypothetical protein